MKLTTRISLLVGVATSVASSVVAFGVLSISHNSALSLVDERLTSIVDTVRTSDEDPLSAALNAVESQEITLVLEADDGTETVLQDTAGSVAGPEKITKSISLGFGERILFGVSVSSVFSALRASLALTLWLIPGSALVAMLLTWLLLARDMRVIRRLIANARDISSGKSAEISAQNGSQELNELGESLQTMVSQLSDSKEKLQVFLSDASHELRTPLTVIRGYLEMLEAAEDLNNSQARKAILKSQSASLRMQRLINDLLTLAELGEEPNFAMAPVSLPDIAEGALDVLRHKQPGRQVTLNTPAELTLVASNDLLTRFFENAISNIMRYTPEDAKVEVTLDRNAQGVQIEIEDAGPGISGLENGVVLTTFNRFETHGTKAEGSSGLGLSIMAQIIEAHGGQMSISRSRLGGLNVTATLPNV